MKQLTTETWYAVVFMEVYENKEGSEENKFCSHTKVIALSNNRETIQELSDALNEEHKYPYKGKTDCDVIYNYPEYAGKKLYVTAKLNLSKTAIKHYEDEHRIIGHLGFKLTI